MIKMHWQIQQKIHTIFILKVVIPVFPVFTVQSFGKRLCTTVFSNYEIFGSLLEAIYQENKEHTEPSTKRV